jgi:hypothetical protein
MAVGLTAITLQSACSAPELTAEQAARMSNNQLCQTYSFARRLNDAQRMNRAKTELRNRGELSENELQDIYKYRLRDGMKEHIAICSWGPYQDINTTNVRGQQSKQIVIDLDTYIYTENGRVYAWQD